MTEKLEKAIFECMVEGMIDGVVLVDADNNICFCNKAAEEIRNVKAEKIVGKSILDCHPPKLHKAVLKRLKDFRNGRKTGVHRIIKVKDKYFENSYSPIIGSKGEYLGAVVISRDITQRKKLEEKLKEYSEMLEEKVKERTKEVEEAKNKLEFLNDLMGHDINNINQIILGYLEILERTELSETQKKFVKISLDSIKNSTNLISNVKKIQMIEDKTLPLEKIDLSNLLIQCISEIPEYMGKKTKINFFPQKKYYVMANFLLKDVFFNLLQNAIKFTPEDKVLIDIEISDNREYYNVLIIDRGCGIPDNFKKKIFKRFERGRGSGLGLYLTKKIIESFGGKIVVRDRVKGDYTKGSVFEVSIPKVE